MDQAIAKSTILEDAGIDMKALINTFGDIMTNFISSVDSSCQITKLSDFVCWYLYHHKDLRLMPEDSLCNDGIVPFSSQQLPYVHTKLIHAFHSSSLNIVREELKKVL